MADLEGAQSQFLYEHRETCNQIAVVQVVVFVLSFIFTYSVWWSGLFGLLVAVVGYYGSLSPVVQSKVSFIQFVRTIPLIYPFIPLTFAVLLWKLFHFLAANSLLHCSNHHCQRSKSRWMGLG